MANYRTGKVRLSYPHLFEKGNFDKYSASLLIPKTDKEELEKITKVINEAKAEGKTTKFGGKTATVLPLMDGDTERPDNPEYAGHYYLSCNSSYQPKVSKPIGKKADGTTIFQDVHDSEEVYSGCYVRAVVNFYPYNYKGKCGIAAGLNGILKVADGERLGGGAISIESEFADFEFEEDLIPDEELPFT